MTSHRGRTLGIGLGIARLYPAAWRAKYGADMDDFLHHRGVRVVDLPNLALGLVDAHIHVLTGKVRWPTMTPSGRRGLTLLLTAWALLAMAGIALVKASEDGAVGHLARSDGPTRLSLLGLSIAGLLSAAVMFISGSRLVVDTVRRLTQQRDWVGIGLLVTPAVLGLVMAAVTVGLAHALDNVAGRTAWVVAWVACGFVAAAASIWTLVAAARRAEPPAASVQRVVPGAVTLGFVAVLALAAELVWSERLTTLGSGWNSLDGVLGVPLAWSSALIVTATLASAVLAVVAARLVDTGLSVAGGRTGPA